MALETQLSVAAWGRRRFSGLSERSLAMRLLADVAALKAEWSGDGRLAMVTAHAAEVVIKLYCLASRCRLTLKPPPALRSSYAFQYQSAVMAADRLRSDVTAGNWAAAERQLQHLLNTLWLFCELLGQDLWAAVDARMAVLRAEPDRRAS